MHKLKKSKSKAALLSLYNILSKTARPRATVTVHTALFSQSRWVSTVYLDVAN